MLGRFVAHSGANLVALLGCFAAWRKPPLNATRRGRRGILRDRRGGRAPSCKRCSFCAALWRGAPRRRGSSRENAGRNTSKEVILRQGSTVPRQPPQPRRQLPPLASTWPASTWRSAVRRFAKLRSLGMVAALREPAGSGTTGAFTAVLADQGEASLRRRGSQNPRLRGTPLRTFGPVELASLASPKVFVHRRGSASPLRVVSCHSLAFNCVAGTGGRPATLKK